MSGSKMDAEEQPWLGARGRRGWRDLFLRHRQNHSNLILHTLCFPVEEPWEKSSQNHRMVEVGRDLCGSPSPAPCQSRVTQSRLHSTASRRVLSISREGDSTASLASLGQGSITLRVKKFFLMFRWNSPCFSLCPLPLVPPLGTTGKRGGRDCSLAKSCFIQDSSVAVTAVRGLGEGRDVAMGGSSWG